MQLNQFIFQGGMLGLFCGISFLSIFELFFWISKAIFSQLFVTKIKSTRKATNSK